MRALHMTLEVGFNLLAAASLSGRCAKVCAGAQNQIGWFCRACSQCHSREAKRVLHFYTDTSTRFCRQYTLYYVKFSSLEIVTLKGPLNLNLLLLTTLVVKCRHGLQLLCWCPVWAHHGRRLQEQANLSIDDESFSVLPTTANVAHQLENRLGYLMFGWWSTAEMFPCIFFEFRIMHWFCCHWIYTSLHIHRSKFGLAIPCPGQSGFGGNSYRSLVQDRIQDSGSQWN